MTISDGSVAVNGGAVTSGAVTSTPADVDAAAAFVRDHGDDLLLAVSRLHDLFSTSATALAEAAVDARDAAGYLTGGASPTGEPTGVKAITELGGAALDAAREQLQGAKDGLDTMAKELGELWIPNVSPKYTKIMGHQLVTGLEFGEGHVLGPASAQLVETAKHLDGLGDELVKVATHLRTLGEFVDDAGTKLARAAEKLETTSTALARFAD